MTYLIKFRVNYMFDPQCFCFIVPFVQLWNILHAWSQMQTKLARLVSRIGHHPLLLIDLPHVQGTSRHFSPFTLTIIYLINPKIMVSTLILIVGQGDIMTMLKNRTFIYDHKLVINYRSYFFFFCKFVINVKHWSAL